MFTSVHLFTLGCDTTYKVGTKRVAYQAAVNVDYGLLLSFGTEIIKEEMVRKAEQKYVVFQHLISCGKRFRSQKQIRYDNVSTKVF